MRSCHSLETMKHLLKQFYTLINRSISRIENDDTMSTRVGLLNTCTTVGLTGFSIFIGIIIDVINIKSRQKNTVLIILDSLGAFQWSLKSKHSQLTCIELINAKYCKCWYCDVTKTYHRHLQLLNKYCNTNVMLNDDKRATSCWSVHFLTAILCLDKKT